MTWISFILVGGSILARFFKAPEWVSLLLFALAAAAFAISFFSGNKNSSGIFLWLRKRFVLVVFIPLILVANGIARKYDCRWDSSLLKAYTLRSQTIQWLIDLKEPVDVLVFVKQENKTNTVIDFLQEAFRKRTQLINLYVKNINLDVKEAKMYGVTHAGEVVLVSGPKWVKIDKLQERYLIPGMIHMLSQKNLTMCFITGHGERFLDDETSGGLSWLVGRLTDLGNKSKNVSLITSPLSDLNDECTVFASFDSTKDFLKGETDFMTELAKKGKSFMFALGPDTGPILSEWLAEKGLVYGNELIVNPANMARYLPLEQLVVRSTGGTEINSGLADFVIMPKVHPLTLKDPSPWKWDPILHTQPIEHFRLESHLEDAREFDLAYQAMDGEKPKMVVFASPDFLSNSFVVQGDNFKLFLNSLRWLLEDKIIPWENSIEVKEQFMEMSDRQLNIVKNFVFFGFPGLALLVCFLIWVKHRKM